MTRTKAAKAKGARKATAKVKAAPTAVELQAVRDLLQREGDRGAVLICAAFLEDQLGAMLKAYFHNDISAGVLVDGFNAPLGNFSSRTRAAHALGLITDVQFDGLEVLREVRNRLAHDWDVHSLEDPRLVELVIRMPSTRWGVPIPREASPSLHFRQACHCLLVEMHIHAGANVPRFKLQMQAFQISL